MLWFLVTYEDEYCLIFASDREDAKRKATPYLEHDADRFVVTPIIRRGKLRAIVWGTVVIDTGD